MFRCLTYSKVWTLPFAASGRWALGLNIIIIIPFSRKQLPHGSASHGQVFLTGYKWRQTHWGRNCAHPYPIPRSMLKILKELSTFTFHQPTGWVGITNSKSTSLCQSTIPHTTKTDLFYAINTYYKLLWDAIDPKLILKKKRNMADATDQNV